MCVANVLLAIREMGKFVLSLVSVQLTMGAVTRWHAAWITLVSMAKSSQAEQFHKVHFKGILNRVHPGNHV